MNTEHKQISIDIWEYANICGCKLDFKDSIIFDRECGIELLHTKNSANTFQFKIVDQHKFMLAQIKYGF